MKVRAKFMAVIDIGDTQGDYADVASAMLQKHLVTGGEIYVVDIWPVNELDDSNLEMRHQVRVQAAELETEL